MNRARASRARSILSPLIEPRDIKDDSHGNRCVIIAKRRDFLLLFLIENREGILVPSRIHSGHKYLSHGDGQVNQIRSVSVMVEFSGTSLPCFAGHHG